MIASQLCAITSPLCARVNATLRTLRNPLRAAVTPPTHRSGALYPRHRLARRPTSPSPPLLENHPTLRAPVPPTRPPSPLRPLFRAGFAPRRAAPVRAMSSGVTPDAIVAKNAAAPVIVYSKTYCPYCASVKSLFADLKVPAKIVELDELADGDAVQAALGQVSGMRTVPQVFVGGELLGGCDDTMAAHRSGQLKTALEGVGIAI